MTKLELFNGVFAKQPFAYVSTNEELKSHLNSQKYTTLIDQIRTEYEAGKSVDQLKLNCIAICCPGILMEGKAFEKANVIGNDIVPFDFDHMPIDVYDKLVDAVVQKRKEWNIKFVQNGVRHSVKMNNGSLHVLAGKQIESNSAGDKWIQEQQQTLLQKLIQEVPECEAYFDKAVVHYGRKLFLTKWSDIKYISLDFLEYNASTMNPFRNNAVQSTATNPSSQLTPKPLTWRGVSIDKIAEELILSEYSDLDCKGEAHSAILSVVHTLTCITTNPQELYFAVQNIAKHHDDGDKQRICQDAFKCTMGMIPNKLKEIVGKLNGNGGAQNGGATTANTISTANTPTIVSTATTPTTVSTATTPTTSSTAPQQSSALLNTQGSLMPQQMPAGFKVFLSIFPEDYREMACNMLFGSLQLYCSEFETVGANGDAEPIVLNTCAIAGFGGGKTAIMRQITRYITDRVEKSDAQERQKLEQWRQQKVQKNGTGTLSAQPTPRVRIFSNASRTQILGYAVNTNGLCQVIMTDELQPLAQYEKRNSFASLSELLRQGFNNGVVRNDTASSASVNCSCHVKIGSCTATQASYLYDFFGDGFDGLPSRVYFHIQPDIISANVQPFKFPDVAGEQVINDMLDTLENTKGTFDLKQTKKCLNGWYANIVKEYEQEKVKDPNADPSKVMLAGRCCQTGLRVATIMFALNGQKEGKIVEDWALYVAEKSLKNLWILYADKLSQNKINASINEKVNQYKAKDTNKKILSHLADSFNVNDMMAALQAEGMASASQNASNKITQLLKAKLIEKKGKGKWRKSIIGK